MKHLTIYLLFAGLVPGWFNSVVAETVAESARSFSLETAHYDVTLTVHCAEGNVSCDQVTYAGTSKGSGNSITLEGATWHTLCTDGSPCRFLGYRFNNGDYRYIVYDSGLLEVIQGESTVLVSEQGEWHY